MDVTDLLHSGMKRRNSVDPCCRRPHLICISCKSHVLVRQRRRFADSEPGRDMKVKSAWPRLAALGVGIPESDSEHISGVTIDSPMSYEKQVNNICKAIFPSNLNPTTKEAAHYS